MGGGGGTGNVSHLAIAWDRIVFGHVARCTGARACTHAVQRRCRGDAEAMQRRQWARRLTQAGRGVITRQRKTRTRAEGDARGTLCREESLR